MRKYINIILLLFCLADLYGQDGTALVQGQVSFISTKDVYVKFRSTRGIALGDTLFAGKGDELQPFLVVKNISSISCLCMALQGAKPAVADNVIARVRKTIPGKPSAVPATAVKVDSSSVSASVSNGVSENIPGKTGPAPLKQHINGSISLNSYSDISNTLADNSQRFRYTLSLDMRNIGNSKFSFETYTSFRHKLGEWEEVKNNIFSALKIYNLAVVYDPGSTTRISLGRRINPKLSNIGASDGLQVEKSFGIFSVGAVAGTRPDYTDYGFNKDLLQFGGYIAASIRTGSGYSESSLAFMQQMNGHNIDRRFIYLQHSNSLLKNLYFMGTVEADLYKLSVDSVNNKKKAASTPDLTSLYLSLRYRISGKFSITASYDARKNVIYYETYKSFLDRILEDQMRQGYRLMANYRVTRDLMVGIQGGYRFLKSDPHKSRNLNGFVTYNNVPGANVTVTLTGTYLESSYLTGQIYGANIIRDLFRGKMQAGMGYRYVDYNIPENSLTDIQHMIEADFYWLFAGKMSFGLNYEGTFEQQDIYHRIYVQLRKRF